MCSHFSFDVTTTQTFRVHHCSLFSFFFFNTIVRQPLWIAIREAINHPLFPFLVTHHYIFPSSRSILLFSSLHFHLWHLSPFSLMSNTELNPNFCQCLMSNLSSIQPAKNHRNSIPSIKLPPTSPFLSFGLIFRLDFSPSVESN